MPTRRSHRPPANAAPPVVVARASWYASSYARTAAGGPEEIAAQHAASRAAAARHGYAVVAEFSDHGGGSSLRRPGLDALLAAVEAGAPAGARPTRVYVRDNARLGRFADPRDLYAVVERFAGRGVDIVVGDDPTPYGQAAWHLLGAFSATSAGQEHHVRSARIRAGLAQRRAKLGAETPHSKAGEQRGD